MKTTSKVNKWGNSLAVRIPNAIAQDLGLSENSSVETSSDGITAIIQPKRRQKRNLNELVAAMASNNVHKEVDWGKPVGKDTIN